MKTKSPLLFTGSGAAPALAQLPIARQSDPITSKIAGQQLTSSGKRQTQKEQVLAALRNYPNSTSAELARKSGIGHPVCHKRLPDLEKSGAVEKTSARVCTVTGKLAITWQVRQAIVTSQPAILGGNRLF